jgi:diadenosine tetraphosphate (Ap4A) HIT family hydrolase
VFCGIVAGTAEASPVYEDERVVAFADIKPWTRGHTLVVPRRHAAYLADLDTEDGAQLFRAAMTLAAALRRSSLQPEGVNLMLADGEAAGQEVFHVHVHVVPRTAGDGLGLRFPPDYRVRERPELDEVAAAIRSAL